jgi:hypothetical protein
VLELVEVGYARMRFPLLLLSFFSFVLTS